MAIAFDASTTATNGGAGAISVSHTCTGTDRCLLALVLGELNDVITIADPTYGGVSMTLVAKMLPENDINERELYLFELTNPAAGANTFTTDVTGGSGGSGDTLRAVLASYTGVLQTGQPEAFHVDSSPAASSFTGSVTVATANAWTVWGAVQRRGGSLAASTGSTQRQVDAVDVMGIFDSNGGLGAGSHSMSVTGANVGPWGGIMVSLAPSVAGVLYSQLEHGIGRGAFRGIGLGTGR